MSEQYEQALLARNRFENKNPKWFLFGIIALIAILAIIFGASFFSGSSKKNKPAIEFQKILFEQSDGLLDVDYHLFSSQGKDKRYFTNLNRYSDEIQHRFEVISEFIDDYNISVDKKSFAKLKDKYQKTINSIMSKQKNLTGYHSALLNMKQKLPKLLALNTEINNLLFKNSGSKNHVYYVTRQLFLIERLSSSVTVMAAYLPDAELIVTSADRMGRDMALLLRIYQGLLKGDYQMNVSKINNLKVRGKINKALKLAKSLSKDITGILEQGPDAFQFIDDRTNLQKYSIKLQKSYQTLFFKDY